MEEEGSLLVKLKGSYDYSEIEPKYYFDLLDEEQISCRGIKYVVDPTYDSTFKMLFGCNGAENRLIDMLNALLFPDKNQRKIRKLKYLTNEINKINQKNGKKSLRPDIACEIETDDNIYVFAIKVQIGDRGSFNKRLFNYGTSLRNANSYKDFFALGISISSKVNSNYTKLKEFSNNEEKTLKFITTIQINVDKELENIENGENNNINGQTIKNEGKEFIKLLGLRNWATKRGQKICIT